MAGGQLHTVRCPRDPVHDQVSVEAGAKGSVHTRRSLTSDARIAASAIAAAPSASPSSKRCRTDGINTLDVRCALLGDDLATWRARLAWAPDGSLAVQSQVFGESADHGWTFNAAYRPMAPRPPDGAGAPDDPYRLHATRRR